MNILMIMADQLAAGIMGAYGHPCVRTPRIDELAARGAVFENAYCNSPLCVPSRASMMTGRLASRIESFDNGSELPASIPTFVHALRLGGYRTALAGKMHFIGPDQLHGFEERLTGDIYPAALDWTPDWRRGAYGNPGTSVRKLKTSGLSEYTEQMRYDDGVQARSLDWLARLGGGNARRPFFLCVSFTHPHDPFQITEPYWRLYRDEDIDLPPHGPTEEAVHPVNRWINTHHEVDVRPPTLDDVRRSRRAYYGMVSYLDEKVGQLLDRLETLGMAGDTAVVFTSDHGEMLGEHGMWFKRTFYDGAAKVPLIVSAPDGPGGRRVPQVVSLVDLFPTILDLANLPLPEDLSCQALDGASFVPLLRGEQFGPELTAEGQPSWKDQAVCEYFGEGLLAPMRLLRRGRYKYVHVEGLAPLLFDLASDPGELRDLAGTPSLAEVERDLRREALTGWDGPALRQRILQSQQERILVSRALLTGRNFPWDFPETLIR